MKYKHIFFDLDRTLWDFEQNMRLTLTDIYFNYGFDKFANSPQHFIETFLVHNDRLWTGYQQGRVRKEVLRYKRFEKTLGDYGIKNKSLAEVIAQEYIDDSPKQTALIPFAMELLEYLKPRYSLHIITNGFNEVQFTKLKMCGLEPFFTHVVTSEISGYHKPKPQAFEYALNLANASKEESLMVGDDLEADIMGAKGFGIDQVYFNPMQLPHNVKVTHEITQLEELTKLLAH